MSVPPLESLGEAQRALVERTAAGPMLVRGAAGTGKTAVLAHRAARLARDVFTGAGDRILVTTYTRGQLEDLRRDVAALAGDAAARIDFANLQPWALGRLREAGQEPRVVKAADARAWWERARRECGGEYPVDFYREEWDRVVVAADIVTRTGFIKARRDGRGTRLDRGLRLKVWDVLWRYKSLLDDAGVVEWADVIREARLAVAAGTPPFRAVLCDEIQEYRPGEVQLLRALAPAGPDDLFVAGDPRQRLYGFPCDLDLDLTGGRADLTEDFRATEGLAAWTGSLVEGRGYGDAGPPARACRSGPGPELARFDDPAAEAAFVRERLRAWAEELGADRVALAARSKAELEGRLGDVASGLGVAVTTMPQAKTLDVDALCLAAVEDGVVPRPRPDDAFADDVMRADHERRERSYLYVAATRARERLLVTGVGPSALTTGP